MVVERHWKGKSVEDLMQEDDFFRLTLQTERETAFAEGYAEGFAEGRAESAQELATLLIRDNFSDDDILKYTKLSLDEIAKLKVQV